MRGVWDLVYRQLGDFSLRRGPVGGSASWGKCQLGEVPVGGSATWGKCQLGEVPVGGGASWGKCQLGDFNLSDFLGTIFILIHFYLINATNEHYSLSKIYSINNKL